MGVIAERHATVDGIETHWFEAPATGAHAPVLYVHGVPTAGWEWKWRPFLERTGGFAPDLPGFGESGKLASFDYSIAGYGRWLRAFADQRGLERFSLVMHDWGTVGLALAQAVPERVERLVIACGVPFVPGYRWHVIARQWRRPLLGELAMGFTFKAAMRSVLNRSNRERMQAEYVDSVWASFDHGTQRAILKLYRSSPPEVLAEAGRRLGDVRCPALVVWGARDPYLSTRFAESLADALGGPATVRIAPDAGHWPWLDEPSLIDEIADFLTADRTV